MQCNSSLITVLWVQACSQPFMEGGSVSSGGMPHRAAQHPTTQSTQLFICLAINFQSYQHSCNAFALVQ